MARWLLGLSLLVLLTPGRVEPARGLWGFHLGHHPAEARRQGFAYPPSPAALTGLGANAILLTPSWVQDDVRASEIRPGDVRDGTLRGTIRHAKELGLSVALAPWVSLRHAGPNEWRGRIAPTELEQWWRSYSAFVLHYAELASEERVELFAIGSELSSRGNDPQWAGLAAATRERFTGRIAFVANHDALDANAFEHVDVIGVSAYFPAQGSWEPHAERLRQLHETRAKPLVVFEVGFASRQGALAAPWDDTNGAPVDLEAQRQGYRRVTEALDDADWLDGLFFWTWFGEGGPHDRHYTPRGKPAEGLARRFLTDRTSLL